MVAVPGQRGHVPKRSDQRHRRNRVQVDRVEVAEQVMVPPCPEDVHPLAQDFYEGLRSSGQVKWFEPSDWARARVFTLLLSQQLRSARPSATMYAALQKDYGRAAGVGGGTSTSPHGTRSGANGRYCGGGVKGRAHGPVPPGGSDVPRARGHPAHWVNRHLGLPTG